MKKFLSIVLLLTLVACSLVGCNNTPKHFTGDWKFAEVVKVEFQPELMDGMMELLMEEYNADTEQGVLDNALDRFVEEGTFANFYLKFGKKNSYSYDPFMDRECTWVFYQTSENSGFLSFYTELNASDGNLDPVNWPDVTYDAETGSLYIVVNNYGAFMITLKLTR